MNAEPVARPAATSGFLINPGEGDVRHLDRTLFPDGTFASNLIHWGPDMYFIVSRVPAGGEGPPAHYHDVEQLFFTVSGALQTRIGRVDAALREGELAVIPRGVAHQHRNDGIAEEVHLELIIPGIIPSMPIVHFVDEDERWAGRGQIIAPAEVASGGTAVFKRWRVGVGVPHGLFPPRPSSREAAIFIIDGGLAVEVENSARTLSKDDLLVVRPGSVIRINWVEPRTRVFAVWSE